MIGDAANEEGSPSLIKNQTIQKCSASLKNTNILHTTRCFDNYMVSLLSILLLKFYFLKTVNSITLFKILNNII